MARKAHITRNIFELEGETDEIGSDFTVDLTRSQLEPSSDCKENDNIGTFKEHNLPFEIWSDGFAVQGTRNGGAGVIIIGRNQTIPPMVLKEAAGYVTSSYKAETSAMLPGAQFASDNVGFQDSLLV